MHFQFTTITESDISRLQQKLEDSLAAVRPNAVGIVDSFDIPDMVLGSALGAYDGNVYERLFEEAKKSPLNQVKRTLIFFVFTLRKLTYSLI